jgi:hypothetical protein
MQIAKQTLRSEWSVSLISETRDRQTIEYGSDTTEPSVNRREMILGTAQITTVFQPRYLQTQPLSTVAIAYLLVALPPTTANGLTIHIFDLIRRPFP